MLFRPQLFEKHDGGSYYSDLSDMNALEIIGLIASLIGIYEFFHNAVKHLFQKKALNLA